MTLQRLAPSGLPWRGFLHCPAPGRLARQTGDPCPLKSKLWPARPFDQECPRTDNPDEAAVEQIRRAIPGWDGQNWMRGPMVSQALNFTPDELRGMTWFDVRMAICNGLGTGQMVVLTTGTGTAKTAPPPPARVEPQGAGTIEELVKRSAPAKEPSDNAFKAYRAHRIAGKTQTEIADMLFTNQLGRCRVG